VQSNDAATQDDRADTPLVQDPSGLWMVSFTDPARGYTRRRSTGERDKRAAQAAMPSVVAAMFAEKVPKTYKLSDLLDGYGRARGEPPKKDSTTTPS